ncbi:MAG: type I-C CRISPR-associated endonuclease Cas1c [Verrucomicrobia bacterium]|nr:type I-C CRISPR-associated endonuclease Cas1c [Verrucomicrobiota bacterium]MBU1735011.1 type I-C CRISPR-associated endonuclease Cas1c [Verrucomicrobiota bacterium]MBU1855355.1 type I-C CRISPR-associated endonuclease Cas1c [Verrucomicrobiota bacterium]
MKRLLNTLFVTTQGAYLCHEGESVLVKVEKETRLRVPLHMLGGIVCFGQVACSQPLMGLCGERGVLISFLTEHGRFLARVQGPVSGNVLLRREQYRRAERPDAAATIARAVVLGKVANCRTVLQRATRDHAEKTGRDEIEVAARRLGHLLKELEEPLPVDTLRGKEGDAANTYFGVFNHLITAQKEAFFFHVRSRRPPLDNMNALLSFLYTLLVHDASAALESVGLDPQVGFLHVERPGRPSLALDLIEEFRPFLADRLALSLVNLRQLQGKDFERTESGAVTMSDAARKELLTAYQKRKQEEIQHPFLDETVSIGLLFHVQALLMARHLRGDLDGYPPFIWK